MDPSTDPAAPTPRPDWGTLQITEDLRHRSADLARMADDYRQEMKSWTHPAARAKLARQAADITDWSQAAALAATEGDYWTRLDALELATNRHTAARRALTSWWQLGEQWNAHRLRPVPASIGTVLP